MVVVVRRRGRSRLLLLIFEKKDADNVIVRPKQDP
jgi:hypothetical protein